MTDAQIQSVCKILSNGGVGVLPTDTIFGLVARAHDRDAVLKTYALKNRNTERPFLVAISDIAQIGDFGIELTAYQKDMMQVLWSFKSDERTRILEACGVAQKDHERPISIIITCDDEKYTYIHKGHRSIGFRLVRSNMQGMHARELARIIDRVGPVIATSANISGQPFATSIEEAQEYFGDRCDFYVPQQHVLHMQPSIVLALESHGFSLMRA